VVVCLGIIDDQKKKKKKNVHTPSQRARGQGRVPDERRADPLRAPFTRAPMALRAVLCRRRALAAVEARRVALCLLVAGVALPRVPRALLGAHPRAPARVPQVRGDLCGRGRRRARRRVGRARVLLRAGWLPDDYFVCFVLFLFFELEIVQHIFLL
jgi:hypothetical protein